KDQVLEAFQKSGRQLSKDVLFEIRDNSKKYKKELIKILSKEAKKPQDPISKFEQNDWIYSMYLLAEFREKEALSPILKLFSRKGNFLNPLTGDIVLTNLGQIIASVANGENDELKKLVLDTSLNEYCRAAFLEALVVMTELNEMDREDLYHYFKDLFKNLEKEPIFPWSVLAQCSVLLFNKSFLKEIKQAYKNNLIDEIYIDLEEINSYISDPELSQLGLAKKKYGIIKDAITAMDWWANYKEEKVV
ncbi:MAG TPA: DUF1186 domain-containing protein, partial [Leptospiraceae bacterium]|nr:DUF1186 domain-containing protein [Leptospiraceae bacterium]